MKKILYKKDGKTISAITIPLKWFGMNIEVHEQTNIVVRFKITEQKDLKLFLSNINPKVPHPISFYAEIAEEILDG